MRVQLGTPFPHIITIPMPVYRYGDGDDGFLGVSAFEEPGKSATSIYQTII